MIAEPFVALLLAPLPLVALIYLSVHHILYDFTPGPTDTPTDVGP